MTTPGIYFEPDWPAPRNVRSAQSLRTGGRSVGAYASLNLGARVGDDARAVEENRALLKRSLALPADPLWLEQVHGTTVIDADNNSARRGDAVVARRSRVVCAIQTADCLPVLFADDGGSHIAAAHAGWRGLSAGVLEATVQAMAVPATELMAWLGPAIGPEFFEVGEEVRAAFVSRDAAAAAAFTGNARGRWQADLFWLARRRLQALGIARVYGGGLCTYRDQARFFSHRRDGGSGRMATLIWLEA
ncbi:MAG: peptidoglycan editing factor PgeF [Steroidobacteraceae bacterium]